MKKARKHRRDQRGAFTVEAVFIIPLMFFILFGTIYLSILLYQNIVGVAVATRAANRTASYWGYLTQGNNNAFNDELTGKELITEEDYTNRSPYRSILNAAGTGTAQRSGDDYAEELANSTGMRRFTNGRDDVTLVEDGSFIRGTIYVTLTKKYNNPLGNLLLPVGVQSSQEYTTKAEAVVTEPGEFIRNIDFVYDMGRLFLTNFFDLGT